jgi:ParB-like chromosome segregation protein Spo0J
VAWVQVTDNGDTFTLIDGHTRYRICQELDMSYDVIELSFNDRSEVLQWIYENQRGRRNWSPERESYVRGKVYNEKKNSRGASHNKKNTAESIASTSDVTPRTVQRDARFAAGVDRVAEKAPELKSAILDGKSTIKKKELEKLAVATDEAVEAVVKDLQSGARKPKPQFTLMVALEKVEGHVGSIVRILDEIVERYPKAKSTASGVCDDLDVVLAKINSLEGGVRSGFSMPKFNVANGDFE